MANKVVHILYQMFKTRSINMSIYSQGWEYFLPNVGTFHSQRGNKRQHALSFFTHNYLAE